jgi:hypothetical protein
LVAQFQKVNAVFGRRCYLLHHCVLVLGEGARWPLVF